MYRLADVCVFVVIPCRLMALLIQSHACFECFIKNDLEAEKENLNKDSEEDCTRSDYCYDYFIMSDEYEEGVEINNMYKEYV